MTFLDQTILIGCSEKNDRLQFFNYFDDLDAEIIYTAKDMQQMEEMLASEGEFDVLVFEISKQWFQNNNQIIDLVVKHPMMKLVGLISSQIELNSNQFDEINSHVSELIFSPVAKQELVAKNVALVRKSNLVKVGSSRDELEVFLNHYFQPSGLPQILVDVSNHEIKHINESIKKIFKGDEISLEGKIWYELTDLKGQKEANQLLAHLTEKGQLETIINLDFGHGLRPIKLRMNYISVGDDSYYLAEIHDQTEQMHQQQFLNFLDHVTTLEFDNEEHIVVMQELLKWSQLDFCFIVKKDRKNEYKQLVWDCSLNNFAEKFVSENHEFIFRKVHSDGVFEIDRNAFKTIPGDDFLNFYSINAFFGCNCYIDNDHDAVLVAGSIRPQDKWTELTLLFKQLSLHYKQSLAFKVLKNSHEAESQYDSLTDLLNRRYIVKAIENAIEEEQDYMAVMFLDLDRFKVINDSLGHDVGDDVLVNIAGLLKQHVNGYGVAARYAGDEFLVLLNKDVDPQKTVEIAEAIIKTVANPIKLKNGSEINLTISLGISHYPDHGHSVSRLIKHADIALYDAKLNGKNRYSIYDKALDGDQSKQNEEMIKSLETAIDHNQIEVYYQPKIDANTEDIMGFEALVRWEHPELGIISPGLFIPLAEQSELIHKIGLLVIEKSCKKLKKWQRQYNLPLTMSVNLSPVQLNDKNLTEKINKIIERTGIYSKHLDFEITESEKFKSVKDALLMFKKLVNLGCTLSIDDFGTGHSTLDYLRKIPAKTLKIDQVFVKNIGLSPDDEAILDATIDMAKRVGHFIVAEGVETEEQRLYLSQKGCDYFQGYLYSRPVPAKEIERILSQRAEILKNN